MILTMIIWSLLIGGLFYIYLRLNDRNKMYAWAVNEYDTVAAHTAREARNWYVAEFDDDVLPLLKIHRLNGEELVLADDGSYARIDVLLDVCTHPQIIASTEW